jgi:hypothetical protein
MGAGIHAVIQKKNGLMKSGWETVIIDAMQYCSSEIRAVWHDFTGEHFIRGYPTDFTVDKDNNTPDGFWMGEYGHCYLSLEDFVGLSVEPSQHFSIDQSGGTYTIVISNEAEDYGSGEELVQEYQIAMQRIFWELNQYRLVLGYDS